MELLGQISKMEERDKIHYFVKGLYTEIGNNVEFRTPTTLVDAIQIASSYDLSFGKQHHQPNINRASLRPRCIHCKTANHKSDDCRHKNISTPNKNYENSSKSQIRKEVICNAFTNLVIMQTIVLTKQK